MFKIGDRVRVKDTDVEVQGELFSEETLEVMEELDFTGTITKIDEGLYYVGFSGEDIGWVTQVYKEDEVEVVK